MNTQKNPRNFPSFFLTFPSFYMKVALIMRKNKLHKVRSQTVHDIKDTN